MADWSSPQLSSTYTVFRQALNDRLVDAALMFDSASTSATNIPSGAKRWNSSASRFEKYNGSTWSDLSSLYAINISGNAATATTATTANGLSAGVALSNLANKSITYAKIQDVSAQYRILGRRSTGAGSIEEITTHQILDWFTTTQGSILFRGPSSWSALAPGTAGKVLMSGGTGADLYWGTISLSGYAPLAGPTFTGTPSAPTASAGTNTTQIATTAFVKANSVTVDHGYNAVGSFCFCALNSTTIQTQNPGTTFSGSVLFPAGFNDLSGTYAYGTALSGTWKLLGYIKTTNTVSVRCISLFQRIS